MSDANRDRTKNRKPAVSRPSASRSAARSREFLFTSLRNDASYPVPYFVKIESCVREERSWARAGLLFYTSAFQFPVSCVRYIRSLFISAIATTEKNARERREKSPRRGFAEFVTRICTVGDRIVAYFPRVSSPHLLSLPPRPGLTLCRFSNAPNDTCGSMLA